MTTANKTQDALNSLSSELDETIIFIDNITNTSLALANTQFIESRVCDDDIEAEPRKEQQLEVNLGPFFSWVIILAVLFIPNFLSGTKN